MTNLPLPEVVLSGRFFGPFSSLLRDEIESFQREEGGYLLGRYVGGKLIVESFYHDRAAESTSGDIRLSTGAFDKATSLARRKGGLDVIGTWHLHPPGYGAHYSSTDEESLFVDRMVLNATDMSGYDAPWVHIIIPGVEIGGLRAYTLDVYSEAELRLVSSDTLTSKDVTPIERPFGLLVRPRRPGQSEFYPMTRRIFDAAVSSDRLTGIWRRCLAGPGCLRWEGLFVENLVRKLHERSFDDEPIVGRPYTYCRLVSEAEGGSVMAERFEFTLPKENGREEFVPLPVKMQVVLQNPHTDCTHVVTTRLEATVGDLILQVQKEQNLPAAPVLWTLLSPSAAEHLQERTRVEEFGKVYLPENLAVAAVLAQRETPDVPLYWESPDLAPDTVRRLRTHRFASMGYDLDLLRQRHVVVAGLGLLGCGIARILGMLAIGRLTLIDYGCVDWVDIYRQSLYESRHVGQPKVDAATTELTKMGCLCEPLQMEIPSVLVPDIQAASQRLQKLASIVDSADVVVGALDSFSSRAVLQVICRMYDVPFLAASLDYLPELDLTQGSIALFGGGEGQCYGCGSVLKMQKDRGACTNAPLEFPGIVNSLAAKMLVDVLINPGAVKPSMCRVYEDYRIEIKPLGAAAESCAVCTLGRQGNAVPKAEFAQRLLSWLIG